MHFHTMTPNDVKIVADNIDDFIEVPNGIDRLRTAIFALAISGKFAPAGASSWKSSTLGEICSVKKGRKPELYETEGDKMLPYLEAKFIRGTKPPKFAKASDKNSVAVTEDDLIIICDGSNSGEFFTGVNGVLASTMGVLNYDKKIVSKKYLEVFLESNFELFNKARKGAAIPHLDFNLFNSLTFPLPSIEEQKRIVKKVEEVMKQLDELENKKQERDEVRIRLARSAMQSLGKGESKIAFEQLTELVKTPSDIKELENALLTLAVSGKLVSQSKADGTAEDLFNQIQSKRVKIKKLVPVDKKDELFSIPPSWSWVRLEDVFDVRDGTHDSPKYHDSGYPLVTSKNLYYGNLDFLNVKYISESDHKKISERSRVDRDDVLFAMIGSIGNPVIVDTDTEFSIKNVALFKYYDRKLSEPVFLLTYLRHASQNMRAVSAGGVQSFVSLGFLRQYPFPLPPLAEQKRIVKKVEEVTDLINHLKQVIGEK